MAPSKAVPGPQRSSLAACAVLALLIAAPASAQNFPITPTQRAVADQVAQTGVALAELADNAPDNYTVKSGDYCYKIWTDAGMTEAQFNTCVNDETAQKAIAARVDAAIQRGVSSTPSFFIAGVKRKTKKPSTRAPSRMYPPSSG